jgi:hypothetical protein
MATPEKAYYGIQITLADTNVHSLLALLTAIDGSLSNILQNVGEMSLQGDSQNSTNFIYVGDSSVSASRYGLKLAVNTIRTYSKEARSIPLGAMYVLASAATVYLNVEIIP